MSTITPAQIESAMKAPNLVQIGDLWVCDDETEAPHQIQYGLLIQCSSPEQAREALKTGKIEFTVFEHYEEE
jgi:hypothetical protein